MQLECSQKYLIVVILPTILVFRDGRMLIEREERGRKRERERERERDRERGGRGKEWMYLFVG